MRREFDEWADAGLWLSMLFSIIGLAGVVTLLAVFALVKWTLPGAEHFNAWPIILLWLGVSVFLAAWSFVGTAFMAFMAALIGWRERKRRRRWKY